MTPGSLRNCDHLDGPAFAAWLERRGVRARDLDPNRRVLSLWKAGRRPTVFTADSYLSRLGIHLSELPEELWLERREVA